MDLQKQKDTKTEIKWLGLSIVFLNLLPPQGSPDKLFACMLFCIFIVNKTLPSMNIPVMKPPGR